MTDPKNPEQQSEELDLDQLKDAAGGVIHPNFLTNKSSRNKFMTNTFLKNKIDTGSGNDHLTQPKTGWSSTDAEFNG